MVRTNAPLRFASISLPFLHVRSRAADLEGLKLADVVCPGAGLGNGLPEDEPAYGIIPV